MNLKTNNTKQNKKIYLFPFSEKQLKHFQDEIEEAGGFHELMYLKKALIKQYGMKYINSYKNKYLYRSKYLNGIYKSLWSFYDTEIPFIFWSAMYDTLQRLKVYK
ncbi:MAG TPA: hypothetical protein VFW78_09060 [Bacteroidia bacterium]|nr:hypothetical protein [Bacteroidia bacterium]